jgi:Xaa-Pro aminopeptidase
MPAPVIGKREFARRRRNLMALMEPNSIAIIPAATERMRSRDTEYPFRQDSDFLYLTGFPEPEAVMALLPGRRHGQYVLFCRERDAARELWQGRRAGPEGAVSRYDADDAFPVSDIDEILPGLLEGRERVYYAMGRSAEFDARIMGWVNSIRAREASGASPPGEFTDLDHMLHELRLLKGAAELRVMRRAAQVTAAAHREAMAACRPGLREFQLEAELHYAFARGGARFAAYPAIVGGGANACVLHYTENDDVLREGDLVLVDAGCEYLGYAADVTRTFPVGGRFSTAQRALYDVVLAAHAAGIAAARAGNHWNQPHDATVRVITEGLVDLGLLRGRVPRLIRDGAYRDFYMHRAGHWLGLDVHDVGDYRVGGEWRLLEPGMVMTMEPGLYVAPDNTRVAKKWRGIGIRIEDDIAITDGDAEVLSAEAPVTPEAIEALMAA